jgi:hypothetical protein
MLVEHPSGALFVAGYGAGRPVLRKSVDRGKTWTRVEVGSEASGAVGNSDVDLAVAPDGTLYFVSMGYNRKTDEGTSISVGVSRDVGKTWVWTMVSRNRFDDRPWIEVAPDGTAHVIWNDGGVNHRVSRDRGKTWSETARVHPQGGSSHLAVGPAGEVAVRITPFSASGNKFDEGVDLIAVSTDGGSTWQTHPAPGKREWDKNWGTPEAKPDSIDRWVEPIAWDGTGALYSLWTDSAGVWLARSKDRGATWEQWLVVASADNAHFPYLIARRQGELAMSWFTAKDDTLGGHVARVELRDGPPRVSQPVAIVLDAWVAPDRPGDPAQLSEAGEYMALAFLRDGTLASVTTIQDPLAWRYGFTLREFASAR